MHRESASSSGIAAFRIFSSISKSNRIAPSSLVKTPFFAAVLWSDGLISRTRQWYNASRVPPRALYGTRGT
ncbi:MAG TPA: hypothetical protein VGE01_10975, partial [Fimbriimonas sp.]